MCTENLNPIERWRPAEKDDGNTGLQVRWLGHDGAWRYPSGIQAENLLHFDTARCEVRAV